MSLLQNEFKFENEFSEFTVCGLLLNAFHEKGTLQCTITTRKTRFLSELLEALGKLLWIIIGLAWKVDRFKCTIYFVNPFE